jgi:hypothetical protein
MFGLEYLIALMALTAPPGAVEPLVCPPTFHVLQQALHATALHLEILDPREVRYILSRPEDFHSDLYLLRRRYEDLYDAPSLSDGLRFVEPEIANQLLAFNRSYRQHLCLRQPVELARSAELRSAMRESDELYHIWDTVRDARCDYYYVTVRRQALKKLRDLIGAEAYYFGRLPPPVPLWRFQEIN